MDQLVINADGYHAFAGQRSGARRIVPMVLIAVATVLVLLAASKVVASRLYQESVLMNAKCLIEDDPTTGVRGVPSSFCSQKTYETPMIDYQFNACGFRTPQACGPAPAGVTRIVLMGSSLGFGLHVKQADSFAAHLGPILSQRLHRPIDIYNEAMIQGFPAGWGLRANTLLPPRPSLIFWPVTPMDVQMQAVIPFAKLLPGAKPPPLPEPPATGWAATPIGRAWTLAMHHILHTRMLFMLQHFLYLSESQYLSHALANEVLADAYRVPETPALKAGMASFAKNFHKVAAVARAAHVPLLVTVMPNREQAIMMSNGKWDKGFDPRQLNRLIRDIVVADGARYVDITQDLTAMPDPGHGYLPVDGHPTAEGHRMLTRLLADALTQPGVIPPERPITQGVHP